MLSEVEFLKSVRFPGGSHYHPEVRTEHADGTESVHKADRAGFDPATVDFLIKKGWARVVRAGVAPTEGCGADPKLTGSEIRLDAVINELASLREEVRNLRANQRAS
jgi:hypothetical protein